LDPAVYSKILVYDRASDTPSEPIRTSGPDEAMISPMVSPDFLGRFAAAESLGIGYTNALLRHRYAPHHRRGGRLLVGPDGTEGIR
jgi:hypothetical protein